MSTPLANILVKRLGAHYKQHARSDDTTEYLQIAEQHLTAVVQFFIQDPDCGIDTLLDIVCLEHTDDDTFQLHYVMRSSKLGYNIHISIVLPTNEPRIASLVHMFMSADWLEREIYDMFGVIFEGHPNCQRLLLYPGFAHHPLRKYYPLTKSQPLIPLFEVPAP